MLAEQDPRPIVPLPREGMPAAFITVGAIAAAALLFVVLDSRRLAERPFDEGPDVAIGTPPPLIVPPQLSDPVMERKGRPVSRIFVPPVPSALQPLPRRLPARVEVIPTPRAQQTPPPEVSEPRRVQGRLNEPAIVVDGGAEVRVQNGGTAADGGDGRPRAGGIGDDTAARATVIRSRTDVMPIGTLIPAVLETPIDTARPGLVRAVVSRDTPGFDGRRILVPRGSRLIGEYQSDVRGGQNRVLVTWTRLIRPDGVSIRLGSPAADALGGAGVPGQVQSFFLQRFAGAVLQSALQIGVNLASRPADGSVIVGLPAPVNTIGQQVQAANDYRPKITVKQGAVVNIFVARDLDFSGTSRGEGARR